jgi:guanylate kinase
LNTKKAFNFFKCLFYIESGINLEIVKEKSRGALLIISGPSGSGKGTVINKFMENKHNAWLSISCTSRPIRPGDVENKTYYFITKEEFISKINNGEMLEYNIYNGNYYGTPKSNIEEKLKSGIDVILEVDVNGAKNIKKLIPEAICVFIMPPSMTELRNRLVSRGTETKEKVLERFKTAYQEINNVTDYNYVVVNDEVNNAVNKISSILIASKCSVDRIEKLYLDNEEEEIHELLMDKRFINEDIKI